MSRPNTKRKQEPGSNLVDALGSFNRTVSNLGSSYEELKQNIQELNVQISEKNKQLEENLFEVNRLRWFFDSILNSMSNGVIVVDTSGRIALFNREAEELTGFHADNVVGKPYSDIFGKRVSERFSPLYTLSEGDALSQEEKEIETKSGQAVPVRYSTALVRDSQDRTLGAVEVFSDLTGLKRLEKEMQVIKTQAALNEMALLVAHEIRNPLGGIRGYVDLISESMKQSDPRKSMIDQILESIVRLDEIVSTFQMYARPVKPRFVETNIDGFMNDVVSFFESSQDLKKKSIQLSLKPETKDGPIQASIDPVLLEQALLAVLDNAVKSMKEGGIIRVEYSRERPLKKNEKEAIVFSITDSGTGMDPEVLKKAFKPFFTTREKGLGLGLALAKNFVSLHHGEIFAKSEEGLGSTITLTIPIL